MKLTVVFAKRIRLIYWFIYAYAERHYKSILASFIVGLLFFFFLYRITPLLSPFILPEVKRVGIVGRYTPATLPIPVQRLIGAGLTEIAENGEPKPGLAQSWEVSEEGKKYTFKLRNGLYWHDGKPFTSADINYNIRDVSFVQENDSALVVNLKEPFVPLPVLLSRPLLRSGLIGLGPFKVTSLDLAGDTIKSLQLTPLSSGLPQIKLRFYLTEEQAKLAFKLGEIDVLEDVGDVGEFASWKNLAISQRTDHTRYVALFYNINDQHLANKQVRQALSFAVPTIEFEHATGPISPLSWAYSSKVRQYKFDLAVARKLLGNDESTQSAQLTLSTFSPHLGLARRIAESWQNLGFTVNVKVENAIPDTYQILLATQEVPPDPDQYPLWHSTQKDTNITNLANVKIDKLLEDGRVTLNKEERLRIYTDFQKYLVDEAPATFLFYPTVYTITRK